MKTFVAGQSVKCIDDTHGEGCIVAGKVYRITRIKAENGFLVFEGCMRHRNECGGWRADRFVAVRVQRKTHPTTPPRSVEVSAAQTLTSDSAERKNIPLVRGLLDYFPAALAEVAKVSKAGNDKHNPGEPMHHARGKSMDHADCIVRHLVDRGSVDPDDGQRHSAKAAWRALALLQEELERDGAPLARGAKLPEVKP